MLLDAKERILKADITPKIQCRVDVQIFNSFSALAAYYKYINDELVRALLKDFLKRYKNVWNEQKVLKENKDYLKLCDI